MPRMARLITSARWGHLALGIKDRLVGVEAVQVEGHRADAQTLEWP